MKIAVKFLMIIIGLVMTQSISFAYNGVYCGTYRDGYSLYRADDNKDIGYAYFMNFNDCSQAADLANRISQDIACSPYNNSETGFSGYSAYRISDNKDLGGGIFGNLQDCQMAISQTRNGIVCLLYTYKNSTNYYSPYEICTGNDLGTTEYGYIETCQQSY